MSGDVNQNDVDAAFAAAFAEATSDKPETTAEAPAETTNVAQSEAAPAEDVPADGASDSVDDGADGGNEGGVSAEPEVQPPAEQVKETPDRDKLLEKFADLLAKQQEQQPQQTQQPEPQYEAPQLFSQEETQLLQDVEKDFPDIAKAFRVQQRAGNQLLAQYIFNQVADYLKPQIDLINELATRTHESQVRSIIPDYDVNVQKVIDWAMSDTQPKILRKEFERVIREGDAEEVKDLYRLYEQSVTPAQPAKAAPARRAELPATAKKAAALLAPVSSKRSDSQVVPDDALDFDAAFERFRSLGQP